MKEVYNTKQSKLFELKDSAGYYDLSGDVYNISYGKMWYALDDSLPVSRIDEEISTMIPWDCFCGFGVFGDKSSVDVARGVLLAWLKSNLDTNTDLWELRDNPSGFHSMFEFDVNGTGTSGLVCVGNYIEMSDDLVNVLENMHGVFVVMAGANYGLRGESSPFEEFKAWLSGVGDTITPEGRVLISEITLQKNLDIIQDIKKTGQKLKKKPVT